MTLTESPLACNLSAHTSEQRVRHRELLREVFARKLEVRELADGYAILFPAETQLAVQIAEYMALERMCCPFLHLGLAFEANNGPLMLEISGSADAKALIWSSLQAAMR